MEALIWKPYSSSRNVNYLIHKYPLRTRVRLEIRHLGVRSVRACRHQLDATTFNVALARNHGNAGARGVRVREADRASV